MSAHRFIAKFAVASLLIAGACAGFNIWIDPYLVFDAPRRPRLNAVKPAAEAHESIMKAYQSACVPARTIILGSSRTDVGMDPASPAWPSANRPVYNLSLAGAGTERNLRYLQHMLATSRVSAQPDTLVVGLDFEDFLFTPRATSPAATPKVSDLEQRLALRADGSPNPARPLQVWKDYATATLSLDALTDSVHTLLANRAAGKADVEVNGHFSEGQFREWVAYDGSGALFEQKNASTIRSLSRPRRVLREPIDGTIRGMAAVQRLIAFAQARQMRLLLSVQPAHAVRLELLAYMGYWPDYEDWKTALAQIVDRARAGGADIELWDFGGYDSYTSEPVPANGDRTARMRWYWDPVHYTSALGDLMTARMFGIKGAVEFGVRLSADRVADRLAQVRQEQQDYRRRNSAELQRARHLLCRTIVCPGTDAATLMSVR